MDVLFERTYDVTDTRAGLESSVAVRIGVPRRDERPGGDWLCEYEIQGPLWTPTIAIYGVDGLQALMLALASVGAEFDVFERQTRGEVTWLGDPDLGLPSVQRAR